MKFIASLFFLLIIHSSISAQKSRARDIGIPFDGTTGKFNAITDVKGGSLPWYIDTDQPRPFTLNTQTLIISHNKLWKRVLVSAD
ncbi:MAG: hypothetical protein LH619_12660 [Chitinophagaceae bacterium]|nr:hypothetical protein [Chitinophagaceae bacterium]